MKIAHLTYVVAAIVALTPVPPAEAANGKQAAKSKPLRVTVYRTKRRGRYSYKKSDTIGTRNIYRFVHPPRQSSGGPFDNGFFFATPRGPYGGYTPYMQ
ncbi:MAG: hypothetical protein ACR2OY_11650 [Boseongicola sp.]